MLPTPRPVAAVVLLAPPLGALATEWLPHARAAGPAAVAVAAGIGITNALADETLWRGVPAGTFPDEPLRGWLWPAVGFAAWHHPVATDHFGDSSVTDGSGAAGEGAMCGLEPGAVGQVRPLPAPSACL